MKASDTTERLSLYHFEGCPWCERVRAGIEDLGLEVELRDVRRDPDHACTLRRAMGRGTVPVLRIDEGTEPRWISESAEIVRYLYTRYGGGRPPTLFAANVLRQLGATFAAATAIGAAVAPEHLRWPLLGAAVFIWAVRNNLPLLRRLVRRPR